MALTPAQQAEIERDQALDFANRPRPSEEDHARELIALGVEYGWDFASTLLVQQEAA